MAGYGYRRLEPVEKPCNRCGRRVRFRNQYCKTCESCKRARTEKRRKRRDRHHISAAKRRRVEARYLNCFYCGKPPEPGQFGRRVQPLEIDHVVPLNRGGTSKESNLVMACHSCNRSKGSKTVAAFVRYCITQNRFWFKTRG